MGILQLYPQKEFYVSIAPREFRPGQFCWVVPPHTDSFPRILDVERGSPEEHDEVSFKLRDADKPGVLGQGIKHFLSKIFNLRSHEELPKQKAKKRLGIILSTGVDFFPELVRLLRTEGRAYCQEDSLFVIPAYSIESESSLSCFPPEKVARIRCLIYRQFFYFPDSSIFKEGVARFDRIQVISESNLSSIEPLDIALSQDVFALFLAMFIYCITGIKDDDLIDIRGIVREALSAHDSCVHSGRAIRKRVNYDVERPAKGPHGPGDAPIGGMLNERPQEPPKGKPWQPQFLFNLKGDQVYGSSVIVGTDVDLILSLGPPDSQTIVQLSGGKLDELLKMGGELGISIVPFDYLLREGDCYQKTVVRRRALENKLVFKLKAEVAKNSLAGVWLYLDLNGTSIYAFFLSIPLIAE
jgi:hypothetical protein